MKHKINILIPIFALLVLIYGVRSCTGPQIQTETLRRSNMEDIINAKGVIIKYESVLRPDFTGTFEALVQEGQRVSAWQTVAAVYAGDVNTELRSQLNQVNKKIAQIEKNQANLQLFSGDVSRLEQIINEQTKSLIEESLEGDMATVGNLQFLIEGLCEKKNLVESSTKGNNVLAELQAQKAALESRLGNSCHHLTAPCAGLFSASVDGFEQVITPYNMTELTPSALNSLLEQSNEGTKNDDVACKIIKNFRYFVAINVPAERVLDLKTGESINLRFYDLSGDLTAATVFYISPEEDGQKTIILESNRHVESLLKRRFVNLDFVKHNYSGYRVSVKSLRTKDDVTGVFVRRDDVLKFIPVTVVYNTQDTAIVISADENTPLRLYDEVVVSASSYEEGKLLR